MQTRWLSQGSGGNSRPSSTAKTPDAENVNAESYSKNLNAMNDSLHDLQSDIQRLASQQAQIQQMMRGGQQQQQQQQQPPPNPMDPQPFYMAPDHPEMHHTPQRRTWGQPQPIHFAHQGGPPPPQMDQPWSPRRQQWGQRPMSYGYGPSSGYGGGGGGGDPYYQNQRGAYNNGYDPHSGMYGGSPSYSPGYNNYGGAPSPYQGSGGGGMPFNSQQYMSPTARLNSPSSAAAPFRLHDVGASPPSSVAGRQSFTSPVRRGQEAPQPPPMSPTSNTVPLAESSPMSRQMSMSRDSVSTAGVPAQTAAPVGIGSRLHSSVPAPGEEDMAPQNVSFIEEEKAAAKEEERESSESPKPDDQDSRLKRLPDRLSQLNISSGSKTYRVHSDKETSPSPAPATSGRPTISSAFKQNRRSSGEGSVPPGSGPSSLRSNVKTEEEEETLANMKTERLKDDKDACTGFVISFDDEQPKRNKPALKPRRPSAKRTSLVGGGELGLASDGSNSSRKENVPPEVMICIVSCTPGLFNLFTS